MATGDSRSLDARLYRAALRLCPPGFRRDYADEMVADFNQAHDEASSTGNHAVWRFRLLMAVDLARTFSVQWSRTGLPLIALVSLVVPLTLVEGLATLARHATFDIPADTAHAEIIGIMLLTVTAVCLIAMTIVLTLWVWRPIRRGRRC
jgi:hypothetical protein